MGKKRNPSQLDVEGVNDPPHIELVPDAVPCKYVAPDCHMCKAHRERAGDNNRYTEVTHSYSEAGYLYRYIRCRKCRWTWKVVESIKSNAVDTHVSKQN